MSGIGLGAGMGGVQGAASGAMMGAPAGGIGAIPGAILGGLMGALSGGASSSAQEQAKQQAVMGASMAANGNGAGIPHILNAATALSPSKDFDSTSFDPNQWSFTNAMQPATPSPAPMAGQGTANGMTTNPAAIPSVSAPSAMQQALASTAMTMDAIAKNRPQQVQSGSGPHLFIPQGERPPTLGAPIARAESPLQRYALMLRR